MTIPAGFQLPALNPGDEIELDVSVDTTGAFTLVSVQGDDEDDDNDGATITMEGSRSTARSPISWRTRSRSRRTMARRSRAWCRPASDLSGFAVDDRVEMQCALVGNQLTLSRLKSDDQDDDDDGDGGHGGGD